MAAGYDGSIKIDTSIDPKGFNQGIQKLEGSMGKVAASIGGMLAAAFSAKIIIDFGKDAVDAASKMASAFIGLRSVIDGQGKSFDQAKKFIDDFTADGLIPATDAVTAYKNLLSRGYDTSQIEQTLIRLKDSASFGRQAALSIGEAVRGATEGLKNENSILVDNAGVTKNVSMMWKEYAESIGTTAAALTKEQKIQAEVNGIMKETQFQTGDAAKLAGTYAGQIAALGVSFLNLKVALGNIFIPIITAILPYIKMLVDGLTFALNQIAQVVQALFGVESTAGNGAKNITDAAGSADDLAKNTDKAKKAAKGALAAFDDLNVLTQDTAGDGTGAPGTTPLPAIDPGPIDASLGAIDEKIKAWVEGLKVLFRPAMDAFGELWAALQPLGQTIWEGLQWAWENILVPFGTWVISEALPVFLQILAEGVKILDAVLRSLAPIGQWFWDNFLLPMAEWTGAAIIQGLKWLEENLSELAKVLEQNIELVAAFWIPLLEQAKDLAFAVAEIVIMELVKAYLTLMDVLVVLGAAWQAMSAFAISSWIIIRDTWQNVSSWFDENIITPLKNIWLSVWSFIGNLARNGLLLLETIWSGVSDWFETSVISPIRLGFAALWAGVATGAQVGVIGVQTAFDGLNAGIKVAANVGVSSFLAAWQPVGDILKNTILPAISDIFGPAFSAAAAAGITAFNGMADVLRGIFNRVLEMINGLFDGVFVGINGLIENKSVLNIWKEIKYGEEEKQ
jgi:hypothetical protein